MGGQQFDAKEPPVAGPTLSHSDIAPPPEDPAAFLAAQRSAYDDLVAQGLKFDLTRGKPGPEQLDLSEALLTLPTTHTSGGVDVRNYGGLEGLLGLRELFAGLLGVQVSQLVAQGNASLTLMKDVLVDCMLKGPVDGTPWKDQGPIKFICPVPGYDRHHALLEWLGIEMIPVPMEADGPDVAAVEALVKDDPSIKGMWLVPTYANPSGSVTEADKAARLAAMPTAAADFKILWDNAYGLHHLTEVETKTADIISLAAANGHPDRPIMFASTSKITFAGAGVSFLAASESNVKWFLKHLGMGSIGPDKVNHLRHLEFFKDADGVRAHMRKHAEIIKPKFDAVQEVLSTRLGAYPHIATWTEPIGGYFVSLDVLPGTASRVVQLAKEAGVALTPAGASFPYGDDPQDTNIRLAPTFPSLEEVRVAMEAVATCVLLAAAEKLAG